MKDNYTGLTLSELERNPRVERLDMLCGHYVSRANITGCTNDDLFELIRELEIYGHPICSRSAALYNRL